MQSPRIDGHGVPPVEALASLSAVCVDERAANEQPSTAVHAVVPLESLLDKIRADNGTQPLTLWISHGDQAATLCDRVPVPPTPAALSQLWFGVSQTLQQLNQPSGAPAAAAAAPKAPLKRSALHLVPTGDPARQASPQGAAPEDSNQKESWIEGSKRVRANPPRARTIPAEWKEKVSPEYALAQVAKVGGVNILQDERNKHISWRKVARTIEAELDLRPRGNCNQILKKMVEDATGLDLRQRVSQVVGDCGFVVRRRGKSDKQKPAAAQQLKGAKSCAAEGYPAPLAPGAAPMVIQAQRANPVGVTVQAVEASAAVAITARPVVGTNQSQAVTVPLCSIAGNPQQVPVARQVEVSQQAKALPTLSVRMEE